MNFIDELKDIPRDVIRNREQGIFDEGFNTSADIAVDILKNRISNLESNLTNLKKDELYLLQELKKIIEEIEKAFYQFYGGY